MKHSFSYLLVFIVSVFTLKSMAQTFPFPLPYNDSTTQAFLPHFPRLAINDSSFNTVVKDKFTIAGNPIKFWGANIVADGAFPSKELASGIASRMRKMGFNLMRCHHMDNGWGAGSMFLNEPNTRVINETYRDRFEYFVAQMKNEGVFIDLNLLVSRLFKSADGIAGADSITDFGDFKSPAVFDPYLLFLQKEYARNILTHVNPYTGLELINDPVMAVVETTNENSIYRDWMNNALKPFAQGGTLLYCYSKELDSLWNVFLKNKYGTTAALQTAWNNGNFTNPTELLINGNFETGKSSPWVIEKDGTTTGTLSIDSTNAKQGKYCAKFVISNYDSTSWHLQLKQVGSSITKDTIYQVTFWAKSAAPLSLTAYTATDVSPWTTYSWNSFNITTSWQQFSYSFKASETVNKTVRVAFNTSCNATVWFDGITFSQPTITGLDTTETIEKATVKRVDYTNRYMVTNARLKNQTQFYLETERNYFNTMKSFLHDTLGVKVPVTGTAWLIGPEDDYMVDVSDYIDNHGYYDSPQFPGVAWSTTDWYINNTPMIKDNAHGTIPMLFAGYQVKDKPYTISEYNHPYPNEYQSEMLPTIASYASFQGVDALMFFDYNDITDWTTDALTGYFDIQMNHALMSAMPLYAFAFRNNLIQEASSAVELQFSQDDINLWAKTNTQAEWVSRAAVSNDMPMTHKVITSSFTDSVSIYSQTLPVNPTNPYITSTNEITYDTTGLVAVNTPKFISAGGYLQNFPSKTIGALTIDSAKIYGEIAWLSLDTNALVNSKQSVIQVSSFQENTGMQWFNNNTTKGQWGTAPTLQNPQTITLNLKLNTKALRVYCLDSLGQEHENRQQLYAPSSAGNFTITLNQNTDKTLWYGLKAYDSTSVTTVSPLINGTIRLLGNPTSSELRIDNERQTATKYTVYDVQGKVLYEEQGTFTATHVIPIQYLTKGLYLLVVETAQSSVVLKFVKE